MTADLLIFDLDGTLADSERDLADSVNARAHGRDCPRSILKPSRPTSATARPY